MFKKDVVPSEHQEQLTQSYCVYLRRHPSPQEMAVSIFRVKDGYPLVPAYQTARHHSQ